MGFVTTKVGEELDTIHKGPMAMHNGFKSLDGESLWPSDRPSRGYLLAHGLRNCKRNLIVLITLFHIDGAIAKVHDQHGYIEEMSS